MNENVPFDINYSDSPIVNETFNSEIESMNENAYKKIDELDLVPKDILSKFYNTAFKLGTSDAFETLSIEYERSINFVIDKINDYVSNAKKAKIVIEEAINKDKKAHQLAKTAKELALNNYPSYDEVLISKNTTSSLYPIWQYEADRKVVLDNEYNIVWKSNCWKEYE